MFLLHDGTKTSSDYWNNQIILELVTKRGARTIGGESCLQEKANSEQFLQPRVSKGHKRKSWSGGKVEQNNKRRLRAWARVPHQRQDTASVSGSIIKFSSDRLHHLHIVTSPCFWKGGTRQTLHWIMTFSSPNRTRSHQSFPREDHKRILLNQCYAVINPHKRVLSK